MKELQVQAPNVWPSLAAHGLLGDARRALLARVAQLPTMPDGEVAAAMAELSEALEAHFYMEQQVMEAIDYPAVQSHLEQHARVLAALHGIAPEDLARARAAAGLLLQWFQLHGDTADAALAIALQMASVPPEEQAAALPGGAVALGDTGSAPTPAGVASAGSASSTRAVSAAPAGTEQDKPV
jgi:hemerythrin